MSSSDEMSFWILSYYERMLWSAVSLAFKTSSASAEAPNMFTENIKKMAVIHRRPPMVHAIGKDIG